MADSEFAQYAHDLLANLGEVSRGRFFGGVGFKIGEVQFATVFSNTLFFVVDDTTRPHYKARGATPFGYETKNGRRLVQRYYSVPAEVLEDPEQLHLWANDAIAVAMRTSRKRKK